MESSFGNNEDDEPKVCTVFSSESNSSRTIFDTIAFTSPKKEKEDEAEQVLESDPTSIFGGTSSKNSQGDDRGSLKDVTAEEESLLKTSPDNVKSSEDLTPSPDLKPSGDAPSEIILESNDDFVSVIEKLSVDEQVGSDDAPLPCANVLFADAPEIPFPVGLGSVAADPPNISSFPTGLIDSSGITTTAAPYSAIDVAYDAWIPSESTRKILLAVAAGALDPNLKNDSVKLTTPGILHEEDMFDKVAVNMSRIFGEAEAGRRKILDADSVTQNDDGLRELIKLGCYRSAINLTKRLLTLYGQGGGRRGQFSKHTPHSLQIWYTRIALLVRIREFTVADTEVEGFQNFENPDMYYEFYPELSKQGCRGSMVPFHFRLLSAEIPQYMRKTNETFEKLTHVLTVVRQIISNINQGFCEDGNPIAIDESRKSSSLEIWTKRELRALLSLANAAIFCKDFNGAVLYLSELIEKDPAHEMQLKSSLGRLFLQFGDINSAQRYFTLAAELSNPKSETERADVMTDAGLLAIGQNNYAQALKCFQEALTIQPENYTIVNNIAVCLVYLGRVKDALALMESTVRQNTPQLLQENVILNLSTIYELENSDGSKKNALLKQISEYKGDGINLASLKMPNLV